MKKSFLVSSLLVAALSLLVPLAQADQSNADDAALRLARDGSIPVKSAGAYVEVGTLQIQVSVKLGRPSARLRDGTWLYEKYSPEGSDARGTLVVRFDRGRVSTLSLASPTTVAALMHSSETNRAGSLAVNQAR